MGIVSIRLRVAKSYMISHKEYAHQQYEGELILRYQCRECGEAFDDEYQLHTHLLQQHTEGSRA